MYPDNNNETKKIVVTDWRDPTEEYVASVPTSSPSRGGDVAVYVFDMCVFDMNQPSLPTPFSCVMLSASIFMALSTVAHSIFSSDNSLLSHSVLLVLFLSYWSFQLYFSL